MNRRVTVSFFALATLMLTAVGTASRFSRCKSCGHNEHSCHLQVRTVVVPTLITEQRVRNKIVEVEEEREVTCTVFKKVPQERTIKCDCWYLDDEIKQKEVIDKQCMLVQLPVEAKENILIPYKEEYCYECGCSSCKCQKTRLAEATKEVKKSQPAILTSTFSRVVDYCVKTPKKHTIEKSKEDYFTLEPVPQKKKVTVCVPKVVREVYEVQVWKDVTCTDYYCDDCYSKLRK